MPFVAATCWALVRVERQFSNFLLAITAKTAVVVLVNGFQVITINLAGRIGNRPEMYARTYTVK